jgi:uncharacterized DUF497 family protein
MKHAESGRMAKRTYFFLWDDERNVPHLAEHGVTPEEAVFVVENAEEDDMTVSRTTGTPVAFGDTQAGRHLMVAYWFVDDATVYVETAYDVPRQRSRNRS